MRSYILLLTMGCCTDALLTKYCSEIQKYKLKRVKKLHFSTLPEFQGFLTSIILHILPHFKIYIISKNIPNIDFAILSLLILSELCHFC